MREVEIIKVNLRINNNSVKKQKKRVCTYERVSTDSEEQQTSYSSQIKHYSAFKRMIDNAINVKIDMIIAKSISRFARNTLDTLKYVRLLREKM